MNSDTSSALSAIRSLIGDKRVLTSPEAIAHYHGLNWIPARPRFPLAVSLGSPTAVVQPRSVEDIAAILREASANHVPVVPLGAGTGVMGGALPETGGIIIDLSSLNRILSIEPENRIARVQSGVVLADLAHAAEAQGLLFAHDPWSQPIATVGGAIGTNGVGYLAAGYGSIGDQVRGLDVVLATGDIITWSGAVKAPTPATWRLFVGAEGTLGVVASAVIQLFPAPAKRAFAGYRFPTFGAGFQAIVQLSTLGLHPVMVDYEAEEDGPPLETSANLFLAFDGPTEVVDAATRLAGTACHQHGGSNLGLAAAKYFWKHRHDSVGWFVERMSRGMEEPQPVPRVGSRYVDVAVPTARALDYCAEVVAIASNFGIRVHSFGIWARPELVSYILEGASEPREPSGTSPLDQAMDTALLLARREGGSIEYCHGVGVRLAHLLPEELGSAYAVLRQIKTALDPTGILNPGKLGL